MARVGLHEPSELLSPATRDLHRAVVSLMEELEAIDWYGQRADACGNDELRAILLHNRREEIEHAMMALEWIRRASTEFDASIRTYLNREGPITDLEAAATASPQTGGAAPTTTTAAPADRSLRIGSLRSNMSRATAAEG